MKKIKFLSVFMIVCLSLNAQTKNVEKQFYYGFDEKIEIHKVEKKVFIKTKPSVVKSQYEQSAKNRLGDIKTEWQGDNLCKIEFYMPLLTMKFKEL